ncbi:cysteine desulfurase family protein [Rickettsiales endosymbiont of Stachyamoeba lipophora]|uniref:cysteine desulfurase family protein n=1 Tax=Rickettsiales endosymbiont of Stachyamoeba lipophora TaxID=2486578 RepID=UPI000F64A106|nr:cysteine desulfurase family protein [Rickettsiales endosymbiont of Stachyamoeba lipophora]AZL15213.1 cysteine desulfurase [Rickettsiales endosymbiont of Stachyamoeba lipophora]
MSVTDYIYLDHNATTPLDVKVKQAMVELALLPYNPSSIHNFGREARKIIEKAKAEIFSALNIDQNKYHLIFTSSGTEANNWVLKGFPVRTKIISSTEHLSLMNNNLEQAEFIQVDYNGIINFAHLEEQLQANQGALVSVMLANNETGIIQPLRRIRDLTKKYGALLHSDLVQAIGKVAINFDELDLDLFTISAHKIGGPVGIAALFIRKNTDIKPLLEGGGQNLGLRAGTENVISAVGFSEAIKVAINNLAVYQSHCANLRNFMEHQIIKTCPQAEFIGQEVDRIPNTSLIIMPNVSQETQLISMDLNKIAVSAGSACSSGKISSSHVLSSMKIEKNKARNAIRISMALNNNKDDIVRFINVWSNIYNNANSSQHNNKATI